jgi:hypothetical protein
VSANEHLQPDQFRELFHGTKASRVGSIRETDLTPPENTVSPAKWYMLTSRPDEAMHFARADDGAMITYHVPEDKAAEYLYPGLRNGRSDLYALRKPLPASMIHRVDVTAEPRKARKPRIKPGGLEGLENELRKMRFDKEPGR